MRRFWIQIFLGVIFFWSAIPFVRAQDQTKVWDTPVDWSQGQMEAITWEEMPGEIRLIKNPPAREKLPHLYITNAKSNNLVQMDTRTGKINWSFDFGELGFPNGSPSRVIVDADDQVWVGLRNYSEVVCISPQGKLLKIVRVGRSPRALAVDRDGHIWAGAYEGNVLVKISRLMRDVVQTIEGIRCPYGATTDQSGDVWFVSRCSAGPSTAYHRVTKISAQSGKIAGSYNAAGAYGIAADRTGLIWVSSFDGACVHRFRAATGQYLGCTPLQGRGRCVAIDKQNNAWIACSHDIVGAVDPNAPGEKRWVAKVSPAGTLLGGFDNVGMHSIGVAVEDTGDDERIWVISYAESKAYKLSSTGKFLASYASGGTSPYVYSGMTGFTYQNLFQRAQGHWHTTFDAQAKATFQKIEWEGERPEGTEVHVRARVASSQEGLKQAKWSDYTRSGEALKNAEGQFIEIAFRLQTLDARITPTIQKAILHFTGGIGSATKGKDFGSEGEEKRIAPSCSCSSTPPPATWFLLLLGITILGLRKRRV